MNVRGCNSECKRREMGRMMNECKLDILAVSETKMKGKGEWELIGRKGYKSGGDRARGGVAVVLHDEMWDCVVEHKEINERMMYIKMKMGNEKLVLVNVYAPQSQDREDSERFWMELGECVESFGRREKVMIVGDMNAKVGNERIEGIIGEHGVPGVDENGEYLIDMCAARGMAVAGTWYKKKLIHKYTWKHDSREVRSMIDHVVVDRELMRNTLDVTVQRGAGSGISDHYLLLTKMRVARKRYRRIRSGGKYVINVGKLKKREVAEEYERQINEKWEEWKDMETESVEMEWNKMKAAMKEVAEGVCGMKRVGRGKKGTDWWNDELERLCKEKRSKFEQWLESKTVESRREYVRCRNRVREKVKECKLESDERWGQIVSENFSENKKLFWKQVNEVRKPKEKMEVRINDKDGRQLTGEEEVMSRWSEYFEELLNVNEEREVQLTTLGRGGARSNRKNEEVHISGKEVTDAIAKLKYGKAVGMDGVSVEMIKKGGKAVREWFVRLCNVCYQDKKVPDDWKKACIVPIYKGKGSKMECKNYRGISLLSIPGKVYGRIIIQRIIKVTEGLIGEEQCSFRQGRGCIDQVFSLRQMSEKACEKGKQLYMCFVDLEKAYDRVDRKGVWEVMKMYGVGGHTLEAVKSFYEGSKACVRVGNGESRMFEVNVGLRQGCVMSPWLFNLYMDAVMKEVNGRVMGKGVKLEHSGREWMINQLLYADDTVLIADSRDSLQRMVNVFGEVCWRRKLKVNVAKSKVMVVSKNGGQVVDVQLNGERMEQVECFRYLGTDIHENGKLNEEIGHRVREGEKVGGALRAVWRNKKMSVKAMKGMYEAIVVPTVLYGSEAWVLNARDVSRVEAVEMRCLRSMCGVTKYDRVRNERIREQTGVQMRMGERAEQARLRCYGHVMRMDEGRYVRKIHESSMPGVRPRGRPRKRWLDGVYEAIKARGQDVEQAKMCVGDRVSWRRMYRSRRRLVP